MHTRRTVIIRGGQPRGPDWSPLFRYTVIGCTVIVMIVAILPNA